MWLLKCTRDAVFVFVLLISMMIFSSSTAQKTKSSIRTDVQATTQMSTPCVCVPYYYCNSQNIVITNGQGLIDVRNAGDITGVLHSMGTICENYLHICCRLPGPEVELPKCGLRHASRLQWHVPRLDREEADGGEFPWMVTIFRTKTAEYKNETKEIKVYQCQGTLISKRVVLTAAQCIKQYGGSGNSSEPLSIRAGQLDTMMTDERAIYQERDVEKAIVHGKYNRNKLRNNVALLVLQTPVTINKYVDITCLGDHSDDIDENKCLVIGWDKYVSPEDAKSQRSQTNVLRRRPEPYVQTADCASRLRSTPLGRRFKLDNSSICAGGPSSRNFCSGEIGGPLSCPLSSEPTRYVQVGIASWCISSGNLRTPSIFASVLQVREWIDDQMKKLQLDTSAYRATKQ